MDSLNYSVNFPNEALISWSITRYVQRLLLNYHKVTNNLKQPKISHKVWSILCVCIIRPIVSNWCYPPFILLYRGVREACNHQCPCHPHSMCSTCGQEVDPVCTTNGESYRNPCWAKCRSVALKNLTIWTLTITILNICHFGHDIFWVISMFKLIYSSIMG